LPSDGARDGAELGGPELHRSGREAAVGAARYGDARERAGGVGAGDEGVLAGLGDVEGEAPVLVGGGDARCLRLEARRPQVVDPSEADLLAGHAGAPGVGERASDDALERGRTRFVGLGVLAGREAQGHDGEEH